MPPVLLSICCRLATPARSMRSKRWLTASGRSFFVYPDRHWLNPPADATPSNPSGPFAWGWYRKDGGYLDLDTRIWFFTDYYSISPGMISQIPGKGAKYMVGFTDSQNTPLIGDNTYHVSLPPNIPAANFWSLTLYEAENGSGRQWPALPITGF